MTGGEFDRLADELYGLRPDEFAAARDAKVKEARAAGNAPLARELAALRRPTQSAWLLNLLWRDQPEVLEQLFTIAQGLSDAQAHASSAELHRLSAQRRELEAALVRQARALAENHGVNVSASMEREAQETLSAALARPAVAAEVRTGRLTRPASYAGFGTLPTPGSGPNAAVGAPAASTPAARASAPPPTRIDEVAAERALARRQAAEQRVAEARQAVADAEAVRTAQEQTFALAAERQREINEQLAEVRRQLEQLEQQASAAAQAVQTATRQRDHAVQAHQAVQQTLARAERDLADMT